MKKFLIIILIPLVLISQDVQFDYFKAKSLGDDVILEWSMKDELNIDHFKLQKKIVNGNSSKFIYLSGRIDAEGNGTHYRHTDEDSFYSKQNKDKVQHENVKSYRIEATLENGSKVYSEEAFVTHNVSSVRKTWGMLKEMFR